MLKPLNLIPSDTKIDFIGRRFIAFGLSLFLMLAALIAYGALGLNFGIDFRGGILMEVRTEGPADVGDMRRRLGGLGLGQEAQLRAIDAVKGELGASVEYRRVEAVGPTVGAELRRDGAIAVTLAIVAMLLYIWFRFEWQFGIGAVAALVHDVVTTIGLFAILGLEFNLATVAAILTIAGYSINDTVVVYDRVRENLRRYKTRPLDEVFNESINQTLSRTVMTSVTTLLALVALFVFGGAVIRDFSIALIWGVLIGTYSSIWVATAVLMFFNIRAGFSEEEPDPGR
jgi:preprotein translocase subunit SecF